MCNTKFGGFTLQSKFPARSLSSGGWGNAPICRKPGPHSWHHQLHMSAASPETETKAPSPAGATVRSTLLCSQGSAEGCNSEVRAGRHCSTHTSSFPNSGKPCSFSGPACTTHCSGRTSTPLPHKPYLGRHPQMPHTAVLNPPAAGIPVPVPHPSMVYTPRAPLPAQKTSVLFHCLLPSPLAFPVSGMGLSLLDGKGKKSILPLGKRKEVRDL